MDLITTTWMDLEPWPLSDPGPPDPLPAWMFEPWTEAELNALTWTDDEIADLHRMMAEPWPAWTPEEVAALDRMLKEPWPEWCCCL